MEAPGSRAAAPRARRGWIGAALILALLGAIYALYEAEKPPAQAAVEDVKIGNAVAPDGSILAANQGDAFTPGERVYVGMKVADAAAGEPIQVVWYDSQGRQVAQQVKRVEPGSSRLTFQSPDTSSWAIGNYRADVLVGNAKVSAQTFSINDRERTSGGLEGQGFARLTVFYGTDRKESGSKEPEAYFGTGRAPAGALRLGACEVSIPRDHRMGQIERPSIWKLEFRPDPEKHMVLVGLTPLPRDAFFGRLRSAVQKSGKKEALVFVHGFNVSFTEAVLRTAQMSYDLGFDGAPITYSWPSQSSLSPAGYHADENNAEWTVAHLDQFLSEIAARSGAQEIHLIAHSLGNRPLTTALERIAARMKPDSKPLFEHIVLTAPDVDAATFLELARELSRPGRSTTLYASSNDKAMAFSRQIHGGYPRAGDSGPDVVVLPGIDTVDASSVDTSFVGHSYYGDNRSVLSDMFGIIRDGKTPEKRFGLRPRTKRGLRYWVFQPS